MWATNDQSNESEGEPLDSNYDHTDLAPEALERMRADCQLFYEQNKADCDEAYMSLPLREWSQWEQIGHDFWLTRNHHGAGFWDGDYEDELGKRLTDASHKFGEADLYVGDDGMIYHFPA